MSVNIHTPLIDMSIHVYVYMSVEVSMYMSVHMRIQMSKHTSTRRLELQVDDATPVGPATAILITRAWTCI